MPRHGMLFSAAPTRETTDLRRSRAGVWMTHRTRWGILFHLKIGKIVVVVGGVDSVDKRAIPRYTGRNRLPNSVEKLSTYPQPPWISRDFGRSVGMTRIVLRLLSTETETAPNSPTHCTRIIHKMGELSTENGGLSPCVVESDVLRSRGGLVKTSRTYYAFLRQIGR
jgi:hypothetical protein